MMMVTTPAPRVPTTWTFTLCWLGMLLLHAINLVYYIGSAKFYTALNEPFFTFLSFQLMIFSIGISSSAYQGIANIHAAVGTIHAVCMLMMVGSSVAARRLVFYPSASLSGIFSAARRCARGHSAQAVRDQPGGPDLSRPSSAIRLVISSVSRSGSMIFGREGLLGVESTHFEDILVVRELFETALQTYQAYRMTQLLPRPGLIRVYIILLIANCWAVPILNRLYKGQQTKRRMAVLLCDALLDMVSSIGVTLLLFATYASQYNDPVNGFPYLNWYDDHWFIPLYQEFQMMLVVSWSDMGLRLVFALGLLQCMESIKEILEPLSTVHSGSGKSTSKSVGARKIVPTSNAWVGPALVPASEAAFQGKTVVLLRVSSTHSQSHRSCIHRPKHFVLHIVAPVCFVLCGCLILGVHVYAESKTTDWPCSLRLRPWFNSKPACALVEINCQQLGVSGSAASLNTAWTQFEPSLTAHVAVRHCPALVVPTAINQYHSLTSIKVYNSTITSWPETSAVTSTAHSALRALYILRSSFQNATLPPGLIMRDFPKSFRIFIASDTNLASLPDSLDKAWPTHLTIALEGCQLTAVPDVVIRLQPVMVSFAMNPLTSVPASLFEIPTLQMLHLSDTLIQEVPSDVRSTGPDLYFVTLSGTNVSTLWSWMDSAISRSFVDQMMLFNVHDTPFCSERDAIVAGNRTRFSAAERHPMSALASAMDISTPEKLAYSKAAVACSAGLARHYPLFVEDDAPHPSSAPPHTHANAH